jgi:hypothetical protein
MGDAIFEDNLSHSALGDPAIRDIADKLKKHPMIESIINPIVTADNFKSAFKCVPEKMTPPPSGCGVHHYKVCAEGSTDGILEILNGVYADMMSVLLEAGYCPECWKQAIDVMLDKILGVYRSDKLLIIQLLEADLNQVLRISFARKITKLANNHSGTIHDHQYGRSNRTCMTPVLNKVLMVHLLVQRNVFDNDTIGSSVG